MEAIGSNEKLIRSSFCEEEYDKLLQFFQDIWLSDAMYKVFMARRAFNLNYAFMDIQNAKYKDEYKVEGIMSNTALLLCSEELADYYRLTGRFPKIIIADDLLIHGRGIMKLIDNLGCLLVEFLKKGGVSNFSKQSIHEKLRDVISIYVFAQNMNGILLDRRFALKPVMRLPAGELRALSQKISRALQQCGVANTSYVLSAELPWDFCKKEHNADDHDGSSLFQYRGNVLHYYYRNNMDKVLETIRAYYSDRDYSIKHIATSLAIFGNIAYDKNKPDNAFNVLCRKIAEEIRQIVPYSRIGDILGYEQPLLARARAQMISYLLSVLGFADFYREKISAEPKAIYKALLHSDYMKIAANFDRLKKLQFELIQLFDVVSRSDFLQSRIFGIVENFAVELNMGKCATEKAEYFQMGRRRTTSTHPSYLKSQEPHEIAEDIFYKVGMNAECDAHRYTQTRESFDFSRPGNDYISLEEYLEVMKEHGVDEIPSIGCVLGLMDSGLLAMNLELNQHRDTVQCILKTGELATFVLPRRFSVLVPALSIIERECDKNGFDKKAVISGFIGYLQEHCYQENGSDSREDTELLCKLNLVQSSLLDMYDAGQSFQDWDVNLLTNEDRLSHGMDERGNFYANQYILWTSNELNRIRYYNYCAKTFLRSGSIWNQKEGYYYDEA